MLGIIYKLISTINPCIFKIDISWFQLHTGLLVVLHPNWGLEIWLIFWCRFFLTIGGEEEMCRILLWQPSDLVDFLFNLQTLQVVKVWLVALERTVDIVLPRVPCLPRLL